MLSNRNTIKISLCFNQRRKTLMNNLSQKYKKEFLAEMLHKFGIKDGVRSEELELKDFIKMSDYMQEAVNFFHSFMYSDVYTNPIAKGEESKVDGIIAGIFEYYVRNPEKMPPELQLIAEREGRERAACDYVSGMTDGYAMEKYSEIFIPMSWTVK